MQKRSRDPCLRWEKTPAGRYTRRTICLVSRGTGIEHSRGPHGRPGTVVRANLSVLTRA